MVQGEGGLEIAKTTSKRFLHYFKGLRFPLSASTSLGGGAPKSEVQFRNIVAGPNTTQRKLRFECTNREKPKASNSLALRPSRKPTCSVPPLKKPEVQLGARAAAAA